MRYVKAQLIMLCILILVMVIYGVCYMVETEEEIETLNQRIEELTEENAMLYHNEALFQNIIDRQRNEIEQLTRETEQLKSRPIEQKTSRGSTREPQRKLTYLGEYNVTGYCSCEVCCGQWAKDRPGDKVYGAAGEELTPGISVAGWLPLGSRIMIDDQEYIVQDRTAKRIRDRYDGKIIDIYCGDHQTAWAVGNEKHDVWMIEEGAP